MPRNNSRIPLVRTTCWASNAIIGTFASSQNPKPLNDLSSSVTVAAKSLAGHRGVRPFLEGHTFTWLTFDEAGNTLPEEGLSRVLLDEQSFGRDLEEPAMPSSAPLQAVRTLRPKMLGVQALRMLQSPLAGHKGVRPSLEGHTFTWVTFDESGEPLPEAALSQILLDQQSLGVDLKELPSTHIRGHSSSVPWLTNDFVVGCDGWTSMQGQQLCQQPQGW